MVDRIDLNKPHYWVFKHRPGKNASEDDCKKFVSQAITYNFSFMQYEYDYQDHLVTHNWKCISKIKEGDYIFLRGGDYIYAVGRAIRPRLKADITLSVNDIIEKRSHGNYVSGKYNGIVSFSDSDVFYENLSEEDNNWGQRIDVDSWKYYCQDGIYAKSLDLYFEGQNRHGVILELVPEKGEDIINELKKALGMKSQLADLLLSNYNLVLTGAPGTGKTYLAKQLARLVMFGKSEQKELSDTECKEFSDRFKFVQFHPSYDYTDFVEGLRPINNDGQIGFERRDGIFKNFCKKAIADKDKPYVFIIDEINRGDMSKILGELFFSIDPGYRGEKGRVYTQYQNIIEADDVFKEGFYVPENVYIIGTMNDIDRSVESMDFAMRRRFAWKEITAIDSQDMLDEEINDANIVKKAKNRMNNLNKAIEEIESLSKAYHIGPAYFLKLKKYLKDNNELKDDSWEMLWENHLEGLLYEYLRGLPNAKEDLDKLHLAFNNEEEGKDKMIKGDEG